MKKLLFALLLVFPALVSGQTGRYASRFVTGKALNVTMINGTLTTFDVSFLFSDETGRFTGDNVAIGDFLYFNEGLTGILLPITAILSPGATSLTVRLSNPLGIPAVPTGVGVLTRGTPNYGFLPWVSSGFQENQVLLEDFAYRLDSLLDLATVTGYTDEQAQDAVGTIISAGTGISAVYNDAVPSIVITNTLPDVTVSLTGAGITGVTGTYPNFTITSTEVDGSVTNELQNLSLAGQALGISSGTGVTLPLIGVAAGSGISVSTVSGTATVTNTGDTNAADDLTGSGTTNYVTKWTSATALGNSVIQDDGTQIGVGAAPVSGFRAYFNASTRTDGVGVFRGTGNVVSGLTAAGFRMWNTTATTGDTWYMSSQDDGTFLFQSGNGGSVMTASTAADITVTNRLKIGSVLSITPTTLSGRDGTGFLGTVAVGTGLSLVGGTLSASGGTGTVTSVAASAPASGFTITGSPITTSGTLTFALNNDLLGLENLATTGITARTGTSTWATRTLTAGAGISITNGDGISGNPTIASTTSGTVTSVGLTMPSIFSVTGSPVTSSGTLAVAVATATANQTLRYSGTTTLAATSSLLNDGTNVSVGATVGGARFRVTGQTGAINTFADGGALTSGDALFHTTGTLTGGFAYGLNASVTVTGGNLITRTRNAATSGVSNAIHNVSTSAGSTGDPMVQFQVEGSTTGVIGKDNSATNDPMRISAKDSSPGATINDGLTISGDTPSRIGVNKDAPGRAMDVVGITRTDGFENVNNPPTVTYFNGAGTGPSTTLLQGGANFFVFGFTTGTTPTANGNIAQFTLPSTVFYTSNMVAVWSPGNSQTATDLTKFYVSGTGQNSFTLVANGTLAASTAYTLRFITGGY